MARWSEAAASGDEDAVACLAALLWVAGRAEDSYHAARRMIRDLIRSRGRRTRQPTGTTGPVLLVTDPDSGTVLHLRPDLPDDALRAPTEADLTPPAGASVPVRLAWNAAANRWEQI